MRDSLKVPHIRYFTAGMKRSILTIFMLTFKLVPSWSLLNERTRAIRSCAVKPMGLLADDRVSSVHSHTCGAKKCVENGNFYLSLIS